MMKLIRKHTLQSMSDRQPFLSLPIVFTEILGWKKFDKITLTLEKDKIILEKKN